MKISIQMRLRKISSTGRRITCAFNKRWIGEVARINALSLALFILSLSSIQAQVSYPAPIKYIHLSVEGKDVKMAYMDVPAARPNGKTAMLFHGKNFNGYYWKDVIPYLNGKGYRVIVPDQVGWGA